MPGEEYPASSDDDSEYRSASTLHFLPPRLDDILEINIESLLGTSFELRLSSKTTVGRIKSRNRFHEAPFRPKTFRTNILFHILEQLSIPKQTRVDVMITIFGDFSQFSAKNLEFFLNTNVIITFFQNLALF
jgi:hypothetical protein